MKLLFSDSSAVDITLRDLPINTAFSKMCKSLQHVAIPFQEWDSPFYYDLYSYDELDDRLVRYGAELGLTIERNKSKDQNYLNAIHIIYEKNYDGDPKWLKFHEHIHLCERYHRPRRYCLTIDYRETGGPVTKPIDYSWITPSTKIKQGEVFFMWAELGKTPHLYWENNEPENFERFCELAKPWISFRPILHIALEDIDLVDNPSIEEFEKWWPTQHDSWCKHWNIPKWTVEQIFGGIVAGTIDNVDQIKNNLHHNILPTFLKL
jgi:hypothetical protein